MNLTGTRPLPNLPPQRGSSQATATMEEMARYQHRSAPPPAPAPAPVNPCRATRWHGPTPPPRHGRHVAAATAPQPPPRAAPQTAPRSTPPNVASPGEGRRLSPTASPRGRLGLRAQWYPADGMIYSDGARPTASDARRRGPAPLRRLYDRLRSPASPGPRELA